MRNLLNETTITVLEFTAVALQKTGYVDGPETTDVAQLLPEIADIESRILDLECSKELKETLLESLSLMRHAIQTYSIHGPKAFKIAVNAATMNIVSEAMASNDSSAKDKISSTGIWGWIERARTLLQSAVAAKELSSVAQTVQSYFR